MKNENNRWYLIKKTERQETYCKRKSENLFSFITDIVYEGGIAIACYAEFDVEKYDTPDLVLQNNRFESLDELKNKFGENWKQKYASMIFECECCLTSMKQKDFKSLPEAKKFVINYMKEN